MKINMAMTQKINDASAHYLTDFLDIMQQQLTLCMQQDEIFRVERAKQDDPGLYIEAILPDVERIGGEKGQMAVWAAYALFDLIV